MLASSKLMAFVATANRERAKTFYAETLGLTLVSEDPFALVFDANGTLLRIAGVEKVSAAPYTVLGWQVQDIDAIVQGLINAGVKFERYQFLEQNGLGIWNAPGGAKVAWFKDPDGNLLSVSQH